MTPKHSLVIRLACAVLIATCLPAFLQAQQLSPTLNAIFNKHEFDVKHFGPARWIDKGAQYTTVEPSAAVSDGQDIVEYETASGKRTVLVSAAKLMHARREADEDRRLRMVARQPAIADFRQHKKGLAAQHARRLLGARSGQRALKKLGGDAPESSLMFAKFSPDGKSVGFVRANNIYVQDLATDQIRPRDNRWLRTIINGTTDWVSEEELSLRDAFRWSPDSQIDRLLAVRHERRWRILADQRYEGRISGASRSIAIRSRGRPTPRSK